MWKDDLRIKNHYRNTGCPADHDSTWPHHYCLRRHTCIINSYIYQWTDRLLFDHRNLQYIDLLSGSWPLWRNDHRDMDSNGCVWKSACTGNKKHYRNTGSCTCIYQCTCGCNGSLRIDTISTDSGLQQRCKWILSDSRYGNSYKEWNGKWMRRHTD